MQAKNEKVSSNLRSSSNSLQYADPNVANKYKEIIKDQLHFHKLAFFHLLQSLCFLLNIPKGVVCWSGTVTIDQRDKSLNTSTAMFLLGP